MYQILESNDYEKLTHLFFENGLEIEPGIGRPDNVVKCWECVEADSRKLIGGAALEIRNGELVVADMAVNPDYRKAKIGTNLMRTVEEEIEKMGGKEAWLVAKVPMFYIKLGWKIVDREQAPDISKCFSCLKYGKECTPKVMYKSFEDSCADEA